MNTLDIAKAITQDDIDKAKLMHFSWKADCMLDGIKSDVDKVCKDKGINRELLNTVFAITQMRIESIGFSKGGYTGNNLK